MENTAELEKAVLDLPAAAREHLALAAWESLEADPDFVACRVFDPEGLAIALKRDTEIEGNAAKAISHAEFLQRTRDAS